MVIMDIKAHNFYAFRNFHMNMSYPKKIVNSYIENEFLEGRPNFRYKKVNILLGSNATGKTSIGQLLMNILNFMDKKELQTLTKAICDEKEDASFSMDFVANKNILYRIMVNISPKFEEQYGSENINLYVKQVEIKKSDSYESCEERLGTLAEEWTSYYSEELEKIKGLSWRFDYPMDSRLDKISLPENKERYTKILDYTLRALDPSIKSVEKSSEVENAYIIRMEKHSVLVQDGKFIDTNILSSGTRSGVAIADLVTSILEGENGFYYCDEKFSYIHSDIEKAFLVVMIRGLKNNDQLFFTTHNMEILELPLPKHAFTFLKKDKNDLEQPIKSISASWFLKRNTDSLRNAVDNDLFSAAPSIELIQEIEEL